ncbi:synaptonemal complex protein 3-like isoform 1-T3 [Sarcophilus harrisii]
MAPTVKRARTSRKLARTARERRAHGSDQEDGRDLWDSREDAGEGRMPDGGKRGVKRSSPGRAGDVPEEGVRREIQNMLERLGVKFNQVLLGKRKRLEMYAEASLKRSYQKIEHIWTTYKEQRQKLNREYSQHFLTLFQQWDLDIKKTKEEEAKLANIFKQQLKIFQQARMIRIQRLNEIKHLYEKFSKNLEDLEKTHENFLIVAHHELQD